MRVVEAYQQVLERIDRAKADAMCEAGRGADPITLIAVSKTHDADRISPLLRLSHKTFGENRVQEAEEKWPPLKEQYRDIHLSLIGPLQSNKARHAVALFDEIQTVDRLKIAEAIARECDRQDRRIDAFIQVNTGEEPQKAGIPPMEADAFIREVRDKIGLTVKGLMCIPPVDAEPAPHFALLAGIAARNGLACLSMGMSGDYETAIRLGATHIRVGSAIFGHRA